MRRIITGISTIILIIIMLIFVDFSRIQENLIKISVFGILLFALIYSISFLFRTLRLQQIFLGLNRNTSFLTIFCSFGIGWGINEITPGKIGDLARMEFIHEKEKQVQLSKSLCGVSIERFVDLLILFVITCVIMLYMYVIGVGGMAKLNLQLYIGIGALLLVGSIIALLFLFFKTNWILNIIGKISKMLMKRLEGFLKNFLEGINEFREHKKRIIFTLFLSALTWFFETFTLVILFYLTGYEIDVFIIILAQILTFFTKTFPITPGGWIIAENAGALLIFLFYPSLLYSGLLSILILDHILRVAYILTYGISSSIAFNFKLKEIKKIDLMNTEN